MEAVELASNFQSVMSNKTPSIRQMDSIALQCIQQNRVILRPIIDIVILRDQQEIPLRGRHQDDDTNLKSNPDQNYGNILELLNFCIRAGSLALEQYLSTAA